MKPEREVENYIRAHGWPIRLGWSALFGVVFVLLAWGAAIAVWWPERS